MITLKTQNYLGRKTSRNNEISEKCLKHTIFNYETITNTDVSLHFTIIY